MNEVLRSIAWGFVMFFTFVVVIPIGLVCIVFEFIIDEIWKWLKN